MRREEGDLNIVRTKPGGRELQTPLAPIDPAPAAQSRIELAQAESSLNRWRQIVFALELCLKAMSLGQARRKWRKHELS
jgi:hypothetical protein